MGGVDPDCGGARFSSEPGNRGLVGTLRKCRDRYAEMRAFTPNQLLFVLVFAAVVAAILFYRHFTFFR